MYNYSIRTLIGSSLIYNIVPTSSSNWDQSTSTLSFVVPSLNNETDDSSALHNSTDISTTQGEAETSPTAPTVDRPVENSTAINPVLEEGPTLEQGNESEYSSTHNTFELTTYREDAEEVKNDETASSQVDNVQAEPSRSRDVESQPQSAEAPPAQATNSSDLDRYSAYELEIKLKEAKEELDGAKNATESVKKTRDSKQEELNRANDDYEEKKKIWENLAKVAKDKAEIWEKDENSARKANNEYAKAKESYEKANKQLTEEKEKLKKFPDSIRPERLIELRQNKTDKINGKPQLQPTIDRLSLVEQAKYREWETARDEYENDIAGYVRDKCNDKSQALPSCPATEASIEETRPMANQAETDYKLAKIAYDTAINELRDYDKDLRKLEKDIKDLEDAIAEVEYWEGVKKKAEEDQELKRVANETAQEKVKNGRPPEIETATQASIIMKIAERTKKRINNDLKILDAKLNEAKAMETKLESDVGKLEKAYAEARKKEDPQTGSSALLGVGLAIGGLVLVIGAVIGGFFLYRHLKKKGNGPDDKKKPKKGDVKSILHSTQTSTSK